MSTPRPGLRPRQRPKRKKIWVDYLVEFRWVIIVFIVLPISAVLALLTYLSHLKSSLKPYRKRLADHNLNVQRIVRRLKQRDPKRDGLICSARSPNLAVGIRNVDYKRARHFPVDLSPLANILAIDPVRMIVRAEPLVTISQLTRATVPMNLAVPVVPELDDLTIGGLVNGYGIEGSSHVYGLFQDTLVSLEVVLADGRVVRAMRDNEYSDLFYAVPWSQGSLGLLVSVEIKLVRVEKYMRVTYTPMRGSLREMAREYADAFTGEEVPDFVEGLIFTEGEGVVMTGRYAGETEARGGRGGRINRIGRWYKEWFYEHARGLGEGKSKVEYVPTREWYHRHTRSLFWEMKLIVPFADRWWFRWGLGWAMPPCIPLMKMTQPESIRDYYHDMHVVQDMLLPLGKLADALEFLHREMEVYPIWLCPHRLFKYPVKTMIYPEPGFELNPRPGDTSYAQMFTDIGVYYAPGPVLRGEEFDGAEAVRRLEDWLIRNNGFQPQYSVSELTEKDFWRMFDGSHYLRCRNKYGAVGAFMDVYYKCKKGKKTDKEVAQAEAAAAISEQDKTD